MRQPPFFKEFEGLDELASYNPNALIFYNHPKQSRNKRARRKRERKELIKEYNLKHGIKDV